MKQYILIFATFAALSFTGRKFNPSTATAEVNQVQGLYIFTDSKPVLEVEYMGTVKIKGIVESNKYTTIRDLLIKRAKREYPKANGIILSSDGFQADVIKFK